MFGCLLSGAGVGMAELKSRWCRRHTTLSSFMITFPLLTFSV